MWLKRANYIVVPASRQYSRCDCIEATTFLWLHLVKVVSGQQSRCVCISFSLHRANPSFLLHRNNILDVASWRQQTRLVSIKAKIFVAALRQQSHFECIQATHSMWLHRSNNFVIEPNSLLWQQFRCGCFEAASSLWLHRRKNFFIDASRQ